MKTPDILTLHPVSHAQGTLRLPGSKSLSNSALLLAALAPGPTRLSGLLDADDTRVMRQCLVQLGINLDSLGNVSATDLVVNGQGGFPVQQADLFLGTRELPYGR